MGVKIYRLSDRITVKIDELVFKLAPLSFSHKMEISALSEVSGENIRENTKKATYLAMKYAIKDVSGLEDIEGSKYELSFEEDGTLKDECIEELLNLDMSNKLILSCYGFLSGIPDQIVDPVSNKPVEGVEIVKGKPSGKKKKA